MFLAAVDPTLLATAKASLAGIALVPADKRVLIGLGICAGLGLGSVLFVMQIVTQTSAGAARPGAAAGTISLARAPGSSLGASAFGALIFGLIGGTQDFAQLQGRQMQAQVHSAFEFAFFGARLLCVLAAWTASRIPSLSFTAELDTLEAVGE